MPLERATIPRRGKSYLLALAKLMGILAGMNSNSGEEVSWKEGKEFEGINGKVVLHAAKFKIKNASVESGWHSEGRLGATEVEGARYG